MATAADPLIDEKRWAKVQKRGLDEGAHSTIAEGYCAMEAVAYIAREPFSDHPQCVATLQQSAIQLIERMCALTEEGITA